MNRAVLYIVNVYVACYSLSFEQRTAWSMLGGDDLCLICHVPSSLGCLGTCNVCATTLPTATTSMVTTTTHVPTRPTSRNTATSAPRDPFSAPCVNDDVSLAAAAADAGFVFVVTCNTSPVAWCDNDQFIGGEVKFSLHCPQRCGLCTGRLLPNDATVVSPSSVKPQYSTQSRRGGRTITASSATPPTTIGCVSFGSACPIVDVDAEYISKPPCEADHCSGCVWRAGHLTRPQCRGASQPCPRWMW